MLIDVPLQVLMVTAAPFSRTALPLCVAPKPVPEITTWLPMDPVVAETAVITGAGSAAELSDTLSNPAVAKAAGVRLLTPTPPSPFGARPPARLAPNFTQATPPPE